MKLLLVAYLDGDLQEPDRICHFNSAVGFLDWLRQDIKDHIEYISIEDAYRVINEFQQAIRDHKTDGPVVFHACVTYLGNAYTLTEIREN